MAGHQSVPEPKIVRMPVRSDPNIVAAGKRAVENAQKRKGRASTILSDSLQQVMNGAQGRLGQ